MVESCHTVISRIYMHIVSQGRMHSGTSLDDQKPKPTLYAQQSIGYSQFIVHT